jgi:hypothetical protein
MVALAVLKALEGNVVLLDEVFRAALRQRMRETALFATTHMLNTHF